MTHRKTCRGIDEVPSPGSVLLFPPKPVCRKLRRETPVSRPGDYRLTRDRRSSEALTSKESVGGFGRFTARTLAGAPSYRPNPMACSRNAVTPQVRPTALASPFVLEPRYVCRQEVQLRCRRAARRAKMRARMTIQAERVDPKNGRDHQVLCHRHPQPRPSRIAGATYSLSAILGCKPEADTRTSLTKFPAPRTDWELHPRMTWPTIIAHPNGQKPTNQEPTYGHGQRKPLSEAVLSRNHIRILHLPRTTK